MSKQARKTKTSGAVKAVTVADYIIERLAHAVLRIDDCMTARCGGRQLDEIAEHTVAERVVGDLANPLILI